MCPTLQVLQDVQTRLERGGGGGRADREQRGRNEGSGKNANQICIISYKHQSQGLPGGREYLGGSENEAK